MTQARNTETEPEALRLLAVAQAATGRGAEAAQTLAELERHVKPLLGRAEKRLVPRGRGEVALIAGDTASAVSEMAAAVALLPPYGRAIGPATRHGDLWYTAAVSHIRHGQDAEAARLLERMQAGHERQFAMGAWARSFYLLGQIYERRGERRALDSSTPALSSCGATGTWSETGSRRPGEN